MLQKTWSFLQPTRTDEFSLIWFQRVLDHVKASSPHPREDPLSAEMVMTTMDELLPDMLGPSAEFKAELREFVASVARKVAKIHAAFDLNHKKKWSKVGVV